MPMSSIYTFNVESLREYPRDRNHLRYSITRLRDAKTFRNFIPTERSLAASISVIRTSPSVYFILTALSTKWSNRLRMASSFSSTDLISLLNATSFSAALAFFGRLTRPFPAFGMAPRSLEPLVRSVDPDEVDPGANGPDSTYSISKSDRNTY